VKAVKIGVFCYNTDDGADALGLAQEAEALGFESIFCPDHSHVPASRLSPYPDPPYGELPPEYYRMRDPFVTLAAIAATTTKIKLGTSICLIVERDPITTAKIVASLDHISKGRVLLGVGAGWNREEMENHGTDPKTRMTLMKERVEAMKAIWTQDQAEYHGRFVNFDPIFSWPKPTQTPHPPVIVGGMGPGVLQRVIEFGDGWFPGHMKDLDALQARIDELQGMAAAAGRNAVPITIISGKPEFIERYERMGMTRCVFHLPSGPHETTIAALKKLAEQAQGFLDA
jgi:probable F420-dependent oxidoreductase